MDHSHHHGHEHGHTTMETTTFAPQVSTDGLVGGDHVGHHHGHEPMMSHMMMKMYFHTSYGDIVFFQNWMLSNCWETLFACVIFFAIAILYEGLKCYREYHLKLSRCNRAPIAMISSRNILSTRSEFNDNDFLQQQRDPQQQQQQSQENGGNRNLFSFTGKTRICTSGHLYQSFLHIVQVAVSYTLMLAFMTFNVWLCLSILFGAGVGYFIFCWRKMTVFDINEHCH